MLKSGIDCEVETASQRLLRGDSLKPAAACYPTIRILNAQHFYRQNEGPSRLLLCWRVPLRRTVGTVLNNAYRRPYKDHHIGCTISNRQREMSCRRPSSSRLHVLLHNQIDLRDHEAQHLGAERLHCCPRQDLARPGVELKLHGTMTRI